MSLVNCVCSPQAAISPSQPIPHCFYTGHDTLWESFWSLQISHSGHDPSWLLVHFLAGRARETEKSFTWAKHCSAKPSVCYQHYSPAKSKTHLQLLYYLLERKLSPSQLKLGQSGLTEYIHALKKKKKLN